MNISFTALLEGRPSRDYSVVGPEAAHAQERGLAEAEWFRPHVDPDRLRELTERTNARAIADALLWISLIIGFGVAAVMSLGHWWAIPLFIAYGAVYGGAADARWHEFGHGTACKSERINNGVYLLASFLLWRGPTVWRWSHFRHHSDTIVVGRDPEIQVGRPATIRKVVLNYTGLVNGPRALSRLARHAFGRIDDEALDFVPPSELRKVVWESRIFVVILAVAVAVSVATASFVPVLLIGLPTIYGVWLVVFFGATQHLGLREDVLDHRANSRTVYTNPVFRFLYLNMNYHVEHHMFPSVPYYHLPALHEEIKESLPEPSPSMWDAYREIVGELLKQRRDEHHELAGRVIPDVLAATGHPAGTVGVELPDGTHDFGSADALPAGSITRVDVGDRTFAVTRLGSDVCVVDGICTHGQAHLAEGAIVEGQIECPKHNGRFDLRTGAPCRKPVRQPIRTHEASVVDGRINVRLASGNTSGETFPAQKITP